MKKKNLFRSLAAALVLTLMLVTIPAAPVMAAPYTVNVENNEPTSEFYEEPMGTIGDSMRIRGTGSGLQDLDIYFSSQSAGIGDDIDDEVTAYKWLVSTVVNGLSETFDVTNVQVPAELNNGIDDEDVHGGVYYVYITRAGLLDILAFDTFTVTGIAEITDYGPEAGTVGTEVEIEGVGLAPDEDIIVEYDGDDITEDVEGAFADNEGDFKITLLIPESEYGEHDITITGEESLAEFELVFFVEPDLGITPISGEAGTTFTLTGTGFDKRNGVNFYFNGSPIAVVWLVEATGRTTSDGNLAVNITVPDIAPGSYTILAEDEDDDDIYASITFTVIVIIPPLNPDITVTPDSGNVGDTITVSGTEFASDDTVTIYFDGASIGTAPTDGDGSFSGSFNIPASPAGSHIIKAEDTEDYSDTATISVEPEMNMTPLSGLIGDVINVNGTGFGASKNINILYGTAAIPPTATIVTGPEGSFTGSFPIPAIPGGSRTLTVTDGINSINVSLTVEKSVTMAPASGKLGDGVGIAGFGFGANRTISVLFNNVLVTLLVPVTTGDDGAFSNVQFYVPASSGGVATITISDGTTSENVSFTVEPSAIVIDETTTTAKPGHVGLELNVSGDGYTAGATVEVIFTSDPVVLKTGEVGANGSFSIDFIIPASVAGEHTISVEVGGVEVQEYTFFMESNAPSRPGLAAIYFGIEAKAPISFDWNESSDDSLPVTYVLQIFTLTGTIETVVIEKDLDVTEYTLTEAEVLKLVPLEKDEYYYWRVQAVDSVGNSSLSDTDTFTIAIADTGGGWPGWLTWLLVGLGSFFLFIFAIMLGRRIAYSSY
ncbi:IPT/TIG domain-containing protein [Chloroflexota bacterium]